MTKVNDVMTKDVTTFSPDASIYDCAKTLKEKRISGGPVVDNAGKVVGVLSEGDIMKLIESHDISINAILPSPLDVLEIPVRMKLGLDEFAKRVKKAASASVGDLMAESVVSVSPDEDISRAAKIMADRRVNRLPVIDAEGKLVGIITRGDIIGAI